MKFVRKHSGLIGSSPEYGAIFMSNSSTRKECIKRGLFGLPYMQADFVKQACSDGGMNIVPGAFCSSGMQFPAQVKCVQIWHCRPLREDVFRDAIRENYFSRYKFNFGLSEVQVQRLLTLFSPKKIERSPSIRPMGRFSTRKQASEFSKAIDDLRAQNDNAIEHGGDTDCKLAFRDVPSGDCFVNSRNPVKDCRLTAFSGLEGEPDVGRDYDTPTGNEQPGDDASIEFRRLTDHRVPGAKDLLGNEFGMGIKFGRDATIHSPFSLDTNTIVPENLRHTENGWSENVCHDKGEFTGIVSTGYPSLWSNLDQSAEHGRVSIEADPPAIPPRRLHLEPSYAKNRETYNLTYPRFLGDATGENTLPYDPDSPSFSTMDSSSCATNTNPVSGQRFTSYGGYTIDSLPPEKVQPFSTEHSKAIKYTAAGFDLGDYVPLPSTHPDYPDSTSMIGIQRFLDEHSGASKLATADFASGDNYHPLPSMLPDYPASSSRPRVADSKAVPTNTFSNEFRRDRSHLLPRPDFLSSVESAEKLMNFESLSQSSSPTFYRSFLHRLPLGDGVDLPIKDRVNASRGNFRDDFPDFNKAGRAQSTRRSVFSRLGLPPKECDTKMDTSEVDESVDEVMSFLHECHEHWMKREELKSITRNVDAGGNFEMKKQKTRTAEPLEDDPMSPTSETALNDALACEETMQQPVQKPTFIDFKRRSERQKSRGDLTQGCKEKPEDPAPRLKKRKLVRPKLVVEEPLLKKENKVENVTENKVEVLFENSEEGTESKKHPGEDGNMDGNNEEVLKHEEDAKEKEDVSKTP
ncbi:PREDICTED: uncharacterized protein LOC104814360 isoform X2 [Tarenaya hassleriana]|uniref:uncharacterized protein LOC104814360 isoform X2 n=1 Tax=Tarenaya hassleriana TaxID=28532 RepID=UPI00053C2E96|nr:PREDICTED: uncharacterized protein LOC104814360 isoform X2 [Tarenaya hassleriana]